MKLNDIDFNKLVIFCQIVESGNYQRASEVLRVTPSALSQTITSLESSLGFLLFNRIGKKLIPTQKGLSLHQEFRHHHSSILRTLQKLDEEKSEVSGILKVGAYLEFAKSKLTPVLKAFISEFPDVQIKMTFDTPTRLNSMVMKGKLDLCFSIFPSRETKAISSESIYQEELVLIAGRNLISDSPSYEEIMRTPMIEYYFNHELIRKWLSLHFQKKPKKIPVRIFAATAEMVMALVRENAGIGVIPAYLVTSPEILKEVKVIRPTSRKLLDHIWLLEKMNMDKKLALLEFKKKLLVGGNFVIE